LNVLTAAAVECHFVNDQFWEASKHFANFGVRVKVIFEQEETIFIL